MPGEVKLCGLVPDTVYHYRVLDCNWLGITEGPEQTFTTQPATAARFALPDGRAWEMVSPPDKRGVPVEALTREGGWVLASEAGDAMTYVADGPITAEAQGNRAPEPQPILSRRSPGGWITEDIAPPNDRAQGLQPGVPPIYQFFTPDLSLALMEPFTLGSRSEPPLASGAMQTTPYIRDNLTGTYQPLVTDANVTPGLTFGKKVHLLKATPDVSHVVLASEVPLTAGAPARGLYEWSEGRLQLVSVPPRGATILHEAELGYSWRRRARDLKRRLACLLDQLGRRDAHRPSLYARHRGGPDVAVGRRSGRS